MSEKPLKKKSAMPIQLQTRQPRPSDAEILKRTTEVLEMIMEGHKGPVLLQLIAERYDVGERTAHDMVSRAKQLMIENNRQTIEESAAEISAHYWDIINQTKRVKEFNTSIAALKEVSKLKGLDQVTVNHVVHNTKELEEIPIDAIEAELVDKKDE